MQIYAGLMTSGNNLRARISLFCALMDADTHLILRQE
jgi:hypothetical protein